MEERIKALEGISYSEWQKLKLIIDNRFAEIKGESIFNATEDTFKELNEINRLEKILTAHK